MIPRRLSVIAGAVVLALAAAAVGCGSSTSTASSVDPSCAAEPDVSASAPAHASRADVQAILAQNCAISGCHATAPGAGNLVLAIASPAWVDALVGAPSRENPSMSLIKAGAPDESWLFHKVEGAPCSTTCDPALGCGAQMPLGGQLSAAERGTLLAWIKGGATRD